MVLSGTTVVAYNMVDLGARGDGRTDNTKAFLDAWVMTCGLASPTTIYVPPGRYLLRNEVFHGCNNHAITFKIHATLLAPFDYLVTGDAPKWLGFQDIIDVSIIGGVLDS